MYHWLLYYDIFIFYKNINNWSADIFLHFFSVCCMILGKSYSFFFQGSFCFGNINITIFMLFKLKSFKIVSQTFPKMWRYILRGTWKKGILPKMNDLCPTYGDLTYGQNYYYIIVYIFRIKPYFISVVCYSVSSYHYRKTYF